MPLARSARSRRLRMLCARDAGARTLLAGASWWAGLRVPRAGRLGWRMSLSRHSGRPRNPHSRLAEPRRLRPHHRRADEPRRVRSMEPTVPVPIEGTVVVVVRPIVEQSESDDRDADLRAVGQQRHCAALIHVADVGGIDPATVRAGNHVAPCVVAQTALHGDLVAGREDRDHRIVARRAGAKVGIPGGVRGLRLRLARQREQHHRQQDRGDRNLHVDLHRARRGFE